MTLGVHHNNSGLGVRQYGGSFHPSPLKNIATGAWLFKIPMNSVL